MNAPAIIDTPSLPALVAKAADRLTNAISVAEVLDARDMARAAYDAAKSAARLAEVRGAHDAIMATVYHAQADALNIEAQAKRRLADEIDAAKERGELIANGRPKSVPDGNGFAPATAAEIGFTRKEIHEARAVRDAELADPGIVRRTLDTLIEAGEEPTKAAINRAITAPRKPQVSDDALWLWGRLRDFDRMGVLDADPAELLAGMTEAMRVDVRRLAPLVRVFIEDLEVACEPA